MAHAQDLPGTERAGFARWSPHLVAAAACALFIAPSPGLDVRFRLTETKGQPVADAVVSLTPLDAAADASGAATGAPVEIEQRGEQFLPFVTAVRTGTTVRFPNRDTISHHVYSQSPARPFEFPLYKPNTAEALVFDKPGVVTIGCNIHDWMIAYIKVVDTPWFAVVPASGTATLPGVPAGRYRAEVWHPRLSAPMTREVSVTADEQLEFSLTLKPERRIRRGPDGAKAGYR